MTDARQRLSRVALTLAAFLCVAAPALAQAPAPAPSPTTAVLANLRVKPDADRAKMPGVMPTEVRETVQLYLDGKIQQWFSHADGRGVMFILNVTTVDAARTLMEGLPLFKAGLVTFDYTALTPLTPLRMLIAPPAAAPKGQDQ